MTEKEKRDLEYKKQLYELAKRRKDQEAALQSRDEYRMPDAYDADGKVNQDERMALLTKRFQSVPCPATAITQLVLPIPAQES